MTKKAGPVQGIVQFREQSIGISASHFGPRSAEQIEAYGMMSSRDFLPLAFKARITRFREPRAGEQLIRYAVKSRYDNGDRFPACFSKNNLPDSTNALGGGKRRPPELQNFHEWDVAATAALS
jgi:hypothetical protein